MVPMEEQMERGRGMFMKRSYRQLEGIFEGETALFCRQGVARAMELDLQVLEQTLAPLLLELRWRFVDSLRCSEVRPTAQSIHHPAGMPARLEQQRWLCIYLHAA